MPGQLVRSYRWCFIVEAFDRRTGVMLRERFLMEPDATHRYRQQREAGYTTVTLRKQRIHATGPPSLTNPGYFNLR